MKKTISAFLSLILVVAISLLSSAFLSGEVNFEKTTIKSLNGIPLPPIKIYPDGDVNNDSTVNEQDAEWLAEYLVGIRELTDTNLKYSDYNKDGKIDVSDCVGIAIKAKQK